MAPGTPDSSSYKTESTLVRLKSKDQNVLLTLIGKPAGSIAAILPVFLSREYEVNMKYVKLGYHYLITHAMVLMLIPLFVIALAETWFRIDWGDILQLWENLRFNLVSSITT